MKTVRILIYTDYDQINLDVELFSWGITELKKMIKFKTRRFVDVQIDWIYRFASKSVPTTLTRALLSQYHQLWVLGFNARPEKPYQLDSAEVAALSEWMDKPDGNAGGLLVAGDHAAGFCDIGDPKTFSAHGRSLGELMKRAGQLRVWEGPPTACTDKPLNERDNFNTCEGTDPEQLDDIASQSDGAAANLLHLRGPLHRLFWFKNDARGELVPILKFPDHPHESSLKIPTDLDDEWPAKQPTPEIIVKVRDKRFPVEAREYPVLIAYDGHKKGVGRIVVDSSFHHYINTNMESLPERDFNGNPTPDSDLDQIAQFFANLALWLTPKALGLKIKLDLLYQIATHPDVFEVRGTGLKKLGSVGRYALRRLMNASDAYRLLAVENADRDDNRVDNLVDAILLGSTTSAKFSESERTVLLGAVIEAHHQYFEAQGAITPDWLETRPRTLDMIKQGIERVAPLLPSVREKLDPLYAQAELDFRKIGL